MTIQISNDNSRLYNQIADYQEVIQELGNRWGATVEEQRDQIQQIYDAVEDRNKINSRQVSQKNCTIKMLTVSVICLAIATAVFAICFFVSLPLPLPALISCSIMMSTAPFVVAPWSTITEWARTGLK